MQLTSETLKTVGLVLGGAYFVYKWALGYLMINASLVVTTARTRRQSGIDYIVITATVKKGDRECLQLKKLSFAVDGKHTFLGPQCTEFRSTHAPSGQLRLSPGEETTFETAITARSDDLLIVKTSLQGCAGPFMEFIPAYWEATNVSAPVPPSAA